MTSGRSRHIQPIRIPDEVDLVSFDVFDTLVLRPFVKPDDLFSLVESCSDSPGFHDARIAAEREARKATHREEVTIDDIYSHIPDAFRHLECMEIECELQITQPNPDLIRILDSLVGSGRDVVLASDMYLPASVVEEILDGCGIHGYRALYVSSDFGVTKHNGGLFKIVSEDAHVPFDRMMHIGDNPRSDIHVPRSLGIRTHQYIPPLARYLSSHPDQRTYYRRSPSLERSIVVAMDMLSMLGQGSEEWKVLGRRYGGPIVYAYVEHLLRRLRPGSLRLFASRDGYTPMRALQILGNSGDCRYVHAQRLISYALTEDKLPFGPVRVPARSRDRFIHDRMVSHMRYVMGFLGMDVPDDDDDMIDAYNSNVESIDWRRKELSAEYRDYIHGICDSHDSVDIVDSTTMKYTSQRLIQDILNRQVRGHYFVTLENRSDIDSESFHHRTGPIIGWTRVNVPEFFLCSPEPPLVGWSGDGPVFEAHPPASEKERMSVYPEVSEGELDYVRAMREVFGDFLPSLSHDTVVGWAVLSAYDPNTRPLLQRMRWASSPDHSDWHGLIPGLSDVPYLCRKFISDLIFKMNDD